MRDRLGNMLWGIVLILAGVAVFGNSFGYWHFNLFFPGWWTLFIIVPCLVSMVQGGINVGNLIGLGAGVLLLLAANDVIPYGYMSRLVLPGILVIIGLAILIPNFGGGQYGARTMEQVKVDTKGIPTITAVFSGQELCPLGESFHGANATAVFGGVELNLKNAQIEQDVMIRCTCIFGGIDIVLPPNVKVKSSGTQIFGGVDKKVIVPENADAPTVYVDATCIFGGVDIQ